MGCYATSSCNDAFVGCGGGGSDVDGDDEHHIAEYLQPVDREPEEVTTCPSPDQVDRKLGHLRQCYARASAGRRETRDKN